MRARMILNDVVNGDEPIDVEDSFDAFNKAAGADGDVSPYPEFIEYRERGPVLPGVPHLGLEANVPGTPPVFSVFNYIGVETVLKDSATYSSRTYVATMGPVMGRTILEMDPPAHRAYRAILQQVFTKLAMRRWEQDLVTPIVDRLIDGFVADGKTELSRELFFPFPLEVIAGMLGLPNDCLPEFHRLAIELVSVTVDMDKAVAASARLAEMFLPIVAERRAQPRDDVISVLVRAEAEGHQLTDDEIVSFCRLLLPAGAETTYRSSSNLLYGLLTNTHQLNALRDDRGLMHQAIDEGLRWEPPLLLIAREATRDTVLEGVEIPAGAGVVVSLGSANHDPARWDEPERFDIFRARRPHISFAAGPHTCLGMHLARMETEVVINRLFDRLPNLRIDPEAPAPFISGAIFRSPPRLDVVWD